MTRANENRAIRQVFLNVAVARPGNKPTVRIVNVQELESAAAKLRQHARKHGRELFESAPGVIARAAKLIRGADSILHHKFLSAGQVVGFSTSMVKEGLENALAHLSTDELQRHVAECALQGPVRSPELVFHVLAGNLFVSGFESIYTAMLAGSASLVRCSTADQVFPALFQQAVNDVSTLWGDAIRVEHWPVSDTQLTIAACAASNLVTVFGSNESVAAIRAITPPRTRFIPHGTKVSFAILGAEALKRDSFGVARQLAYDFSIYDQQGCLSPRAAFIQQPDDETMHEFRAALVSEMRTLAESMPSGQKDLSESAALARERNESLIQSSLSEATELWSSVVDPFVITKRPAAEYTPGCVNRFVDLRVFANDQQLASALSSFRGVTATIGTAGESELCESIARQVHADRVCPIGQMQKPPLGWTHDGGQPLRELLHLSSWVP